MFRPCSFLHVGPGSRWGIPTKPLGWLADNTGMTTAIGDSKLFKKRLGDYGVNVYQGCEHGCRFCYAPAQPGVRAQKFWEGKTQADWGTVVKERPGLLAALAKELRTFTPAKAQQSATAWGEGRILVSFLCDPYQPLETTQGDTRQVLEQLEYSRAEAMRMVEEIFAKNKGLKTTEEFLRKVFEQLHPGSQP